MLLASTESTPVFMMKDLRLHYQRILKKLGATDEHISCVNVTRLKEKYLQNFHNFRKKRVEGVQFRQHPVKEQEKQFINNQ